MDSDKTTVVNQVLEALEAEKDLRYILTIVQHNQKLYDSGLIFRDEFDEKIMNIFSNYGYKYGIDIHKWG